MSKIFPKIHNEGYKFIIIFAIATIILYFLNGFLGFIGLILTIWCYYFFRDPERISIGDENYLTSPADGVVLQVMDTNGPKELGLENKQMKKISIFMDVFDCHVNRSPCSGAISEILYKPGKFFNASLDKASEDNETLTLASSGVMVAHLIPTPFFLIALAHSIVILSSVLSLLSIPKS